MRKLWWSSCLVIFEAKIFRILMLNTFLEIHPLFEYLGERYGTDVCQKRILERIFQRALYQIY